MSTSDEMSKDERVEYWGMVLEEFRESGLSKTEYCRNNDIPVSTLNYWNKRLSEEAVNENGQFAELILPEKDKEIIDNNRVNENDFQTEMILDYHGLKIRISRNTPLFLLKSILKELGYAG